MSDSIKGVTVVFDQDIHEDHAEAIISAIKQLRHVAKVTEHITVPDDYFVESRVEIEIAKKLQGFIKKELLDRK